MSPLAIVMQCWISRDELSGKISWSAVLSSTNNSHGFSSLVVVTSAESFGSVLSEVVFMRNFDSGMMSDRLNDLGSEEHRRDIGKC